MAILEGYQGQLDQIAVDARSGDAVWRSEEALEGGLPLRPGTSRPFRGVNILLIWSAERRKRRQGGSKQQRRRGPLSQYTFVIAFSERGRHPFGHIRTLQKAGNRRSSKGTTSYRPRRKSGVVGGPAARPTILAGLLLKAPDLANLAAALAKMNLLWDGPTPEGVARALDRLVVLHLRPCEARPWTPKFDRLRAAAAPETINALVADIAAAFLLSMFGVRARPPVPDPPIDVQWNHLPLAAHVAWGIAVCARRKLAEHADILWPQDCAASLVEPPPPQPTVKAARYLAEQILREHDAAVVVPRLVARGLEPPIAARACEWVAREPLKAWQSLVLFIRHERRAPSNDRTERLAVLVDWLVGLARLPVIHEGAVGAVSRAGHPGASLAGPGNEGPASASRLAETLVAALREGDPAMAVRLDDAAGSRARDKWEKVRASHVRATWVHDLDRLTAEDLRASRLPLDWPAMSKFGNRAIQTLASVGGLIGRAPSHHLFEPTFFDALSHRHAERRGTRELNRLLRQKKAPHQGSHREVQLTKAPWIGGGADHAWRLDSGHDGIRWESLVASLELDQAYRRVRIPRRTGGARWLDIPSPDLARVQRRIGQALALWFPGTAVMAAFQPHRGVAWHGRMHAGARTAVIMDIADFFGSVRPAHFRPWLTTRMFYLHECRTPYHPFDGWSEAGREAILTLLFHPGLADGEPYLAQGAPSSPVVANLAAVAMDRRAQALAETHFRGHPWSYSRYADDVVLSSPEDISGFAETAERLLAGAMAEVGWRPNRKKTRSWQAGGPPLVLCGVTVPEDDAGRLGLPRETARRVRVARHRALSVPPGAAPDPRDAGLLAFAHAVTGDPALLGMQARNVRALAEAVVGPLYIHEFLRAWTGA